MSTPAGRPLPRPDFLDYAPKRVRESLDPRRADSPSDPIPIVPRSPAQPEHESGPDDDERHDAPLVPDDRQDEGAHHHHASHQASRDDAAYDGAPYDEERYDEAPCDESRDDEESVADRRREEAAYDDSPYEDDATPEDLVEERDEMRAHRASRHETELTEHENELGRLVTMLKSIRRDNDGAPEPEPDRAPWRRTGTLPPLGSVHDSDVVIDGLRVPPSLRPSRVPPPPRSSSRGGHLSLILGVGLACIVATGLAWFVAGGMHASPTAAQAAGEPAHDSAAADQPDAHMAERGAKLDAAPASYALATAEPAAEAPKPPVDEPPPAPAQTQTQSQAQSPAPSQTPAPAPAQTPTPAARVVPVVRVPAWPSDAHGSDAPPPPRAAPALASLPPAAAPQASPAPEPPAPTPEPAMNAQEIDLLLKQGKQFIEVGDLATARTVLQRAADAGVAPAALALAETYDPAVLAREGVRGLNGDVAEARRWYTRALALGSAEAGRRLAAMPQP
ncbi:MAG TPA: hypothetical protein VKX28_00485 [Xanthobacteraceae bacterium]|nr:hypothetical protein [Xanthobacteraceae bacterium]